MRARELMRALAREPFMAGVLVLFAALCLLAFGAPLLFGDQATAVDVTRRLQAPSWLGGDGGVLGTDQLGRPLWIRLAEGLRTTLLVGLLAVLVGAVTGVTAGLAAGFYGRRVDAVIMRLADVQMSFPALLLAMTIVAIAGGGMIVIVGVLGLNSWMIYARLTRSVVLRFRGNDFVIATINLGATPRRVMFGHLLPNALPQVVSMATLEAARLMLAEATLSFLGFGVQPPAISIGTILGEGRDYLTNQWWVSTFAGILLALAVLCANLLGNWAQRVSDPLTKHEMETSA
ncbi:ABC transporter permease [Actinomadura sp. WMMB 499]|uniref:ABC transporter permease n=1 Tax=Actinomadura sp. WMMB 499 TaxID=1219491 RepID=UPI0012470DA9|nr:ABC transporter permease [Actinomadura sp. WMMB 499]QFG26175.1 ABC transporter permease [Actinomadura sp. WMMB 499]